MALVSPATNLQSNELKGLIVGNPRSILTARLAESLLAENQLDEANLQAEMAATFHGDYAPAHLVHGLIQYRTGHLAEAEEALRNALGYDPQLIEAQMTLGDIELRRGNEEAAMRFYQQAAAILPAYDAIRTRYEANRRELFGVLPEVYEAAMAMVPPDDLAPAFQPIEPELPEAETPMIAFQTDLSDPSELLREPARPTPKSDQPPSFTTEFDFNLPEVPTEPAMLDLEPTPPSKSMSFDQIGEIGELAVAPLAPSPAPTEAPQPVPDPLDFAASAVPMFQEPTQELPRSDAPKLSVDMPVMPRPSEESLDDLDDFGDMELDITLPEGVEWEDAEDLAAAASAPPAWPAEEPRMAVPPPAPAPTPPPATPAFTPDPAPTPVQAPVTKPAPKAEPKPLDEENAIPSWPEEPPPPSAPVSIAVPESQEIDLFPPPAPAQRDEVPIIAPPPHRNLPETSVEDELLMSSKQFPAKKTDGSLDVTVVLPSDLGVPRGRETNMPSLEPAVPVTYAGGHTEEMVDLEAQSKPAKQISIPERPAVTDESVASFTTGYQDSELDAILKDIENWTPGPIPPPKMPKPPKQVAKPLPLMRDLTAEAPETKPIAPRPAPPTPPPAPPQAKPTAPPAPPPLRPTPTPAPPAASPPPAPAPVAPKPAPAPPKDDGYTMDLSGDTKGTLGVEGLSSGVVPVDEGLTKKAEFTGGEVTLADDDLGISRRAEFTGGEDDEVDSSGIQTREEFAKGETVDDDLPGVIKRPD